MQFPSHERTSPASRKALSFTQPHGLLSLWKRDEVIVHRGIETNMQIKKTCSPSLPPVDFRPKILVTCSKFTWHTPALLFIHRFDANASNQKWHWLLNLDHDFAVEQQELTQNNVLRLEEGMGKKGGGGTSIVTLRTGRII